MFAGGRVRLLRPLVTGRLTARTHSVAGDVTKNGRSGPLRFVTHRYSYEQGGRAVLVEERDIVYRKPARPPVADAADAAGEPPEPRREPGEVGRLELETTPVLLFRFSALTYNAHRIHYDRDFARDTEGYPGLVVHGPLP